MGFSFLFILFCFVLVCLSFLFFRLFILFYIFSPLYLSLFLSMERLLKSCLDSHVGYKSSFYDNIVGCWSIVRCRSYVAKALASNGSFYALSGLLVLNSHLVAAIRDSTCFLMSCAS